MTDPVFTIIASLLEKTGPWALVAVLLAILYSFIKRDDVSAKAAIVSQNAVLTSMLEVMKGIKACLDSHDLRVQSMQNTLGEVDRMVTQNNTLLIDKLRRGSSEGQG